MADDGSPAPDPGSPAARPAITLEEKETRLANAVEEYLAALHDVRDPASIDRVRGWRLSIATAACNWLDARKVKAERLRAGADDRAPAQEEKAMTESERKDFDSRGGTMEIPEGHRTASQHEVISAPAPNHADLIHRLRSRAMIEAPPDNEPASRAAFEDVPEITFDELREIAALLSEAADALEIALASVTPADAPRGVRGGLVLNAYGRTCYHAGLRAAALDAAPAQRLRCPVCQVAAVTVWTEGEPGHEHVGLVCLACDTEFEHVNAAGAAGTVPPSAPDWQLIDTAPKDGTRVLLWWPYWVVTQPIIGWWQVNGGWQAIEALEGDESEREEGPTHWMPLPSAPRAPLVADSAEIQEPERTQIDRPREGSSSSSSTSSTLAAAVARSAPRLEIAENKETKGP